MCDCAHISPLPAVLVFRFRHTASEPSSSLLFSPCLMQLSADAGTNLDQVNSIRKTASEKQF
jgi:hypothetical protein